MNTKRLLYIIMFLAGVVVGNVVGALTSGVKWLSWLSQGVRFGIERPLHLDLGVFTLDFGFSINLTISCIIFVLAALIIAKKVL